VTATAHLRSRHGRPGTGGRLRYFRSPEPNGEAAPAIFGVFLRLTNPHPPVLSQNPAMPVYAATHSLKKRVWAPILTSLSSHRPPECSQYVMMFDRLLRETTCVLFRDIGRVHGRGAKGGFRNRLPEDVQDNHKNAGRVVSCHLSEGKHTLVR